MIRANRYFYVHDEPKKPCSNGVIFLHVLHVFARIYRWYVHFTCRIRFGILTEISTNIRAHTNIREYVPICTPKIRTKIRATMA